MNSNLPPKKKNNGCLKAFLIVFGVMFIVGAIASIFDDDNDGKKITETKKTEIIVWDSLSNTQKETVLNKLVNSDEEPFKTHRFKIAQSLIKAGKMAVKFPDTYEYFGTDGKWHDNEGGYFWLSSSNSTIEDIDKGLFNVKFDYRGENSYGTKVRQSITATFKYDGNSFEIVKAVDN